MLLIAARLYPDQAFFPKLLKDPPNRLHIPGVHGLVVVINRSSGQFGSPYAAIPSRSAAQWPGTLRCSCHAQLGDGILGRHTKLFVDFMFNGQTMESQPKRRKRSALHD